MQKNKEKDTPERKGEIVHLCDLSASLFYGKNAPSQYFMRMHSVNSIFGFCSFCCCCFTRLDLNIIINIIFNIEFEAEENKFQRIQNYAAASESKFKLSGLTFKLKIRKITKLNFGSQPKN